MIMKKKEEKYEEEENILMKKMKMTMKRNEGKEMMNMKIYINI